jgi:sugar (pentulose or hexulose) kinase
MLEVTDIPKRVEIERVFTPRPEHRPLYDRLYTQFRAAYPRLKPICHALNR